MAKLQIPAHHRAATVFLKNLKPEAARLEIADASQPGLYLILQPSGARSWAVRCKFAGRPQKYTLGKFDDAGNRDDREIHGISATQMLTLGEARTLAAQVSLDAKRGIDPKESRANASHFGIEHWLDEFVKTARTKGFKKGPVKAATADEYERIIKSSVKPHWKHVTDIRTLDYRKIEELLNKLPSGAKRNTYSTLSVFFRWKPVARMIGRDLIALVDAPPKPQARERVLTQSEIKRIWNAGEKCKYPFGYMTQLLLLTGQRRDEIANLQWSEISDSRDTIILKGSRTKNGRPHIVPLSDLAVKIISKLPRMTDAKGAESPYVFTTTGAAAFSGFSNGKRALDKQCGKPEINEWHLHDLRRTCATELARAGIKQEVTEAILNHKSGKVSGVAAVYNRYEYGDEKRDALKLWSDIIGGIIADKD